MSYEEKRLHAIENIITNVTGISNENMSPDSELYGQLMIDSLQAIEIKLIIEEEFAVSIPDVEIANVTTIREILKLIEEYSET